MGGGDILPHLSALREDIILSTSQDVATRAGRGLDAAFEDCGACGLIIKVDGRWKSDR